MQTIGNYFFRDMGVMLGRTMRHILRSMNTMSTVAVMAVALILPFVYVLGGAILVLEEIFCNHRKKTNNIWKR
ncbi:hypothetical protein EGT74_13925 [Chitinophaga lutea]|uniref:Uncharacterized protein n=1 Tax=Chitinophaga lutea TaxID=2488634 RepID=A0A3N4PHH9_9BACT|nr:hypothetical protein [Chitinophaga lutea]RPE08162.1 hypothetical protein EGT74_13925 [Chitinophaga lutea]